MLLDYQYNQAWYLLSNLKFTAYELTPQIRG